MSREHLQPRPPWKKGENGWPNGVKPENVGRPPNRIKAMQKATPISAEDRRNLADMLLNATPEEIKAIASDGHQPMFVVTIALAMIEDARKRRFTTWEMLLNWNLGSAVQNVVTVTKDLSLLTDEEYEAEKEKFLKENASLLKRKPTTKVEDKPKSVSTKAKKNPNPV